MAERKSDSRFKIDLDRVVSDPKYRREILRRLRHDNATTHYRPAAPARHKPVVPLPEAPREKAKEEDKPERDSGSDGTE